jgi:hypothetical protein
MLNSVVRDVIKVRNLPVCPSGEDPCDYGSPLTLPEQTVHCYRQVNNGNEYWGNKGSSCLNFMLIVQPVWAVGGRKKRAAIPLAPCTCSVTGTNTFVYFSFPKLVFFS